MERKSYPSTKMQKNFSKTNTTITIIKIRKKSYPSKKNELNKQNKNIQHEQDTQMTANKVLNTTPL